MIAGGKTSDEIIYKIRMVADSIKQYLNGAEY